jgi:hypothetical protein
MTEIVKRIWVLADGWIHRQTANAKLSTLAYPMA